MRSAPCAQNRRRASAASGALQREALLQRPVRIHGAPVRLVFSRAIVANRSWLPWLVEGFEVEDVDAPVEHPTDALRVESRCEVGASRCRTVVGTSSGWSAGLSVPELDAIQRTGNLLDLVHTSQLASSQRKGYVHHIHDP